MPHLAIRKSGELSFSESVQQIFFLQDIMVAKHDLFFLSYFFCRICQVCKFLCILLEVGCFNIISSLSAEYFKFFCLLIICMPSVKGISQHSEKCSCSLSCWELKIQCLRFRAFWHQWNTMCNSPLVSNPLKIKMLWVVLYGVCHVESAMLLQ